MVLVFSMNTFQTTILRPDRRVKFSAITVHHTFRPERPVVLRFNIIPCKRFVVIFIHIIKEIVT